MKFIFPKIVQYAIDDLQKGVKLQSLIKFSLYLVAAVMVKGIFSFLTRLLSP